MDFEEKEINKKDYENDWAKDIKGGGIHIDNAPSGAQGYYCLGCDKEMQAVKFKNPKHQSYFRHHAHNIEKAFLQASEIIGWSSTIRTE